MNEVATHRRWMLAFLLAPALLWLGGLVVLPHIELAMLSLQARVGPGEYAASLNQYRTFVDEPLYWNTFVRTAAMSVLATLFTLLLAFPAAWYIAKVAQGRLKMVMLVLCLLPFWVSEMVRTLGWLILLRETGVVSRLLQATGLANAVGRDRAHGLRPAGAARSGGVKLHV